MEKRDILIGGAWPYANYNLHIGHVAALLPGDVLAKYYRGCGDNVMYVSGSDCHGTPITERAKKENVEPRVIAEKYHESFVKSFNNLGFEYDEYSATMYEHHHKYVQEQFLKMYNNGYIFEKEEDQDYCPKCEKYLSDREIVGKCPHCGGSSTGDQCDNCGDSLNSTEVLDKKCKDCGSDTILKPNKHLYFKLPEFKDELQKLIETNKDKWRKNALGEAQKYIDMGLVNRAATRQLEWGIPVPVAGYEDKRIYVWIEAVLGYMSVGYKVASERGIDFDKFMSNDNPNLRTYYVHGKDNIPFHTTIFPALLLAIGDNYRLPDYIVSSAYVNINDEKMSKSKGNLITADELLEMFDADTVRFYLSFKGPETNDINCSLDDIKQTHNKFLAGGLGNFVNRNLSFINKKFDGLITEGIIDEDVINTTKGYFKEVGDLFEKGEIKAATTKIIDYVNFANKYYDSHEPWIKVKENVDEFNNITYTCIYMINNLSNLIYPVIPNTAKKIKSMLGLDEYTWEESSIKGNIKIDNLQILFNILEIENK